MKAMTWMATLLTILTASPTIAGDTYRLDSKVVPTFQAIELRLDAAGSDYSGSVRIELDVRETTDSFRFHAAGQTFERIELSAGEGAVGLRHRTAGEGVTTVTTERPLSPGPHTLEIGFSAVFGTKDHGLYRVEAGGEGYLFTQFQEIRAREAFPCWDEPEYKIPFQLTLRVPAGHEAVSNTPVRSVTRADAGWKTVEFQTTRPLPTYLLALASGPLESVALEGMSVPGKVYTVRGKSRLAGATLKVTPPILKALEDYFGSSHPYRKLDLLAVPGKGGAMENPGAITFGEPYLLFDPGGAALARRRSHASIVAHELAHLWFGDWVTMRWWDDLWLNESFASWMGDKVLHQLHPEFGVEVANRRWIQWQMNGDARLSTRPVRRQVESTFDISEDLGFAYGKGQTILALVEQWIGEQAFRRGVVAYLDAHAWGSAEAADLWRALGEASGRDVGAVMGSFLDQSGLPLLHLEVDGAGTATLRQSRFLRHGVEAPARRWTVPVALKFSRAGEVETRWVLLDGDRATVDLGGEVDWALPDAGAFGYHRWLLPRRDLLELAANAVDRLSVAERVAFLGNAAALLDGGHLEGGDYLDVLERFAGDPEGPVVAAVLSGLGRIEGTFLGDGDRELYAQALQQMLRPALERFGQEPRPGEAESVALLRPDLLRTLGDDGRDPALRSWGLEASRRLAEDPRAGSGPPVDPALAGVALRLAAIDGDRQLFDRYRRRFEAAEVPSERSRYLSALGRFADPALQEAGLDYALEGPLRLNELFAIPFAVASTEAGEERVFRWALAHWDTWVERLPDFFLRQGPRFAGSCSPARLAAAREFFTQPQHQVEGTVEVLAKVEEEIGDCDRLRQRERASVLAALHSLAEAEGAGSGQEDPQPAMPPVDDRPATVDEFLRLGGRTRVIAHRGFSGRAPENTLAAVRRAIEGGADMVEIDVLLSRDKEVVVIHDDTLERTTDGTGSVAGRTLEEIRRLDAGSWFDAAFAGEKVPTLGEVLDLVRGRILLNVEIKGEAVTPEIEGGIVEKVLRRVRKREMGDQVILSSFAPEALVQARQLDPAVATASLYNKELHRDSGPLEVMTAAGSRSFSVNARRLKPEILDACHRHGRPVAAYTVNEARKMRRLIAMGVDAIFTDYPDRLLRVLEEDRPAAAEESPQRAAGGGG